MKKILLVMGISMMAALAGCAENQEEVTEEPVDAVVSEDEVESDISENEISDSENQDDETVSGNESQNGLEEMEVIELPNGLYGYITTEADRDYAIDGITEWIRIQDKDPVDNNSFNRFSDRQIIIPNVYGTVTDIRMDDYSEIYISYEDKDGENGQAVLPLDFYPMEGNVVEPDRWQRVRVLIHNKEELMGNTDFPQEVWSETFTSGGEEYTASYSRISLMYKADYVETACFAADYLFAVRKGDETVYEIKLYQMNITNEKVYYMEDINGDGIEDFIQMSNDSYYDHSAYPYVFVWDQEQETCIYGGPIAPEEKGTYLLINGTPESPVYNSVAYDRDTRTFYDISWILGNSYYRHDIHGLVILCGARFVDGEWKTVYELYLGKNSEDYAREVKYDEEGNVISEIICTDDEHYALVNDIYDGFDMELYYYTDYTVEEVVLNPQYSYRRYERIEE